MAAKIVQLRKDGIERNATSGRLPNNVYRIREHLTEAEMDNCSVRSRAIAMVIVTG